MKNNKTPIIKYSICVSGAAAGHTVESSKSLAIRLGEAIAKSGHIITTGATVGLPYFAADAAMKMGGSSIGFSPAASAREHLRKYRLPVDAFNFINYTGMSYVGRDLYLVQSSDAIITVGGRFGSLHEFTSALEAGLPCGVLLGSEGTADIIPQLMEMLEPPHKSRVIFSNNPEELVAKLIALLDVDNMDLIKDYQPKGHWYLHGANSHVG